MLDEILISLGELKEKRKHRKEEDRFVEVYLFSTNCRRAYYLRWETGSLLEIVLRDADSFQEYPLVLAQLWPLEFGGESRGLAIAINGIIEGFEWKMKNSKED